MSSPTDTIFNIYVYISPYNSQANGVAERCHLDVYSQIQMMKTWISRQEKMWKSLTKKTETLMSQTSLGIHHQRLTLIIFSHHTIVSVSSQD